MPDQAVSPPIVAFMPFVIIFLIFYVIVIRPNGKERKKHEQMLKNLKKHDEIVTSGGLFGTVVNVKPEVITLRIDEGVRVEVERASIVRMAKSHGAPAELVTTGKKS